MRTGAASVLVLALAVAAPAASAGQEIALGGAGEIYRTRTGRYGDLFPAAPSDRADHPVLALEIQRAGLPDERLLVPGTDGPEVESSPFVLYQDALDTAFVVWQSRRNFVHTSIDLVSRSGSAWSSRIPLTGDFWSQKSAPRLAVTTDTYRRRNAEGVAVRHRRTIIHTLWWEDSGEGERTIYTPVLLIDGKYVENDVSHVLDTLSTSPETGQARPRAELYQSPAITSGTSPHHVVGSFVDPAAGRLLNVEFEVVPADLLALAAEAEAEIDGLVSENAGDVRAVADGARAHILIAGAKRFNPRFTMTLADGVRARILELALKDPRQIRTVADEARAHILIAGSELAGPALRGARDGGSLILAAEGQFDSLIRMRVVADRLAPETGSGRTTLFASRDGAASLVAWESADRVHYRETESANWSVVRTLETGPQLDLDRAHQILARRLIDK